jgi:hypothetical protein
MNKSKDNTNTLEIKEKSENNSTESEYFRKIIRDELQLTDKDVCITGAYRDEPGKFMKLPLFSPCKEGFKIHYYSPEGYVQEFTNSNRKLRNYERIRYAKPNPNKYSQPAGSGVFPFITPRIIEKYKAGEKIKILYLVEGEKKAMAGDKHLGLDIMGIGGIQNFVDKDTNELHPDIVKVIERCGVTNVVLLFDADCLNITDDFEKDLATRPTSFYSAIKRFKEYCKPLNVDLYFAHILPDLAKVAKGLDDLIMLPDTNKAQLKKELGLFTTGKSMHLHWDNISDNSIFKIYGYFGLNNVDDFYRKHENDIGEKEFVFRNTKYFYDGKKLQVSWYGEAQQYLRVGTNYYKRGHLINAQGKTEETLLNWSPGEINRDHYNNKAFFREIPKVDVFCNVPDHTENFKKVITIERDGLRTLAYNRYFKLQHQPREGECPYILKFLRHIANSTNLRGESLYPFLLDWLTLCYIRPTQMLPVLCLVSKERNTGKSTFLHFCRLLFNENATILDNERFTGKFTSHYISKLIIGVDESFIPVDKEHMKERIKNLATGKRQWLEYKGKDAQEIDFFGKLILCSNNERNFMQIDLGENRHCVLKVNSLENDDTRLLEKMEKEVPAFLYFLKHRQLHHNEEKSRSWFDFDAFTTQAMLDVQETTKDRIERELDEHIREVFNANENESVLEFTPKDIAMQLNDYLPYKVAPTRIKDILRNRGVEPEKLKRYNLYGVSGLLIKDKAGTPYLFDRKDWVKNEESTEKEAVIENKRSDDLPF